MRVQTPSEYYQSEFYRFHNGLRILLNIDSGEFPGPDVDWNRFRDSPWRYFISCNEEIARALWAIIERRNDAAEPLGGRGYGA
jgi:hypothetical protein